MNYSSLHLTLILFFFNDTATTEIYTLSLHDALPISSQARDRRAQDDELGCSTLAHGSSLSTPPPPSPRRRRGAQLLSRSEEHTSELQSRLHLVCRLLLEKKNKKTND